MRRAQPGGIDQQALQQVVSILARRMRRAQLLVQGVEVDVGEVSILARRMRRAQRVGR